MSNRNQAGRTPFFLPFHFFPPASIPSLLFPSSLLLAFLSCPETPPILLTVSVTPAGLEAEMSTQWHFCDVVSPENLSGGNYKGGREGGRPRP